MEGFFLYFWRVNPLGKIAFLVLPIITSRQEEKKSNKYFI